MVFRLDNDVHHRPANLHGPFDLADLNLWFLLDNEGAELGVVIINTKRSLLVLNKCVHP